MARMWRKKIDGVEVDSRPMTPDEENHIDAGDIITAFVNTLNPTPAQVKYAVRWLVARELGLPAPRVPEKISKSEST